MHWSFRLISSISPAWPTPGTTCSARKPPCLWYEKRGLPSHGVLHRDLGAGLPWSVLPHFSSPGLIGTDLELCWPRGVSAHLQKSCCLLSEDGCLLNYCSLNRRAPVPFQHRVQQGTLPSLCRAVLLWEGVQGVKEMRRGGSPHLHPCQCQKQGRSHSTFRRGGS